MSFLVEYKDGVLQQFIQSSIRECPSPVRYVEIEHTIISGDAFGITDEEIARLDWRENPNILNTIEGNIALLRFDDKACFFAVDENGFDSFFFYHGNNMLLVSDDFWEIVRIIQPGIADINKNTIKYNIFEGGADGGETIVHGVKHIECNCIVKYDAQNDLLTYEKYQEFIYNNSCNELAVAVEHADRILRKTMDWIKSKCGDVKYGVGLSGGMDSRVVAYYAKKAGMKVEAFNVCVPKPHGLFYAMSIKNARKIAKILDINFHIVPWKPTKLKEKINRSIQSNPYFLGNSMKFEEEGLPKFDVLLTGTGGELLGDSFPNNIDNLSEEEFAAELYKIYAGTAGQTLFGKVVRAMTYLTGIEFEHGKEPELWAGRLLVGENYKDIIKQDLFDFIHSRRVRGKTNAEIYGEYMINICCSKARFGGFETFLSTKRSFSVYIPFMMKEIKTWMPKLFYQRAVLDTLVRTKTPEISNIATENIRPNLSGVGKGLFQKIMAMLQFLLRGNGTAITEYWMNQRGIRQQFVEAVNENTKDWFHKILGIEETEINLGTIKNEPGRFLIRIWELKCLIECFEHKTYLC